MSEEALKENKMGVMPMPKLMLSMGSAYDNFNDSSGVLQYR